MNTIIKILSVIYNNITEFLTFLLNSSINIITFLSSISISIKLFADLLILIGSIILIVGVLFKSPIDVINDSILWADGPGIITAIFYPEKIQEFIKNKNKVVLGLITLIFGFLLSAIASSKNLKNIYLMKWLLISMALFYIVGSLVASYNRRDVIVSWTNNKCKNSWIITKLLDKTELDIMLMEFSKTNQTQEFLDNTLINLNYLKDALAIEDDLNNKSNSSLSLQDVEAIQFSIKKDIENISLFYYLFKPKKLLKSILKT